MKKIVKCILRICVKHNLFEVVVMLFLFLIILITKYLKEEVNEVFDWTMFSASLIAIGLGYFSGALKKIFMNSVEDSIKLTNDYEELTEIYEKQDMLIYKGVTFPIEEVSKLYYVNKNKEIIYKNIFIKDCKNSIYEIDTLITNHYFEIMQAHKTSNVYNNLNIRVNSWSEKEDVFCIETGRTHYYNSLVTNRAMDYEIRNGISIRDIYESGPYLTRLEESKLSNHLGCNGFVISKDNKIVFVERGKSVSIGKRTFGNSIGASLKIKYALNEQGILDYAGLLNGICREVKDELKIGDVCEKQANKIFELLENSNENKQEKIVNQLKMLISKGEDFKKNVKPFGIRDIKLISAYRDFLEGGKPQLCFVVRTKWSSDDITEAFNYCNDLSKIIDCIKGKKNITDRIIEKTISKKSIKEEQMKIDGDKLKWITIDELLSENIKIYPDKLVINEGKKEDELKMVPSSSACVVMLIEWLKQFRLQK